MNIVQSNVMNYYVVKSHSITNYHTYLTFDLKHLHTAKLGLSRTSHRPSNFIKQVKLLHSIIKQIN